MLALQNILKCCFGGSIGRFHLATVSRLLSTNVSSMPGEKVEVNGLMLHHEIVGDGKHAVLLLPGALGSTRTDFHPQLENLNKEKFKIVAWDPPGYGYSRPPDRTFDADMFNTDAKLAKDLMLTLGFTKFSLLGWSDGGIVALILAAEYQENVDKLIVFGANSYISEKDLQLFEATRDIGNWSERMKTPMINLYGETYFKQSWERWCDTMKIFLEERDGDICEKKLKNIKCPTYVIHGKKDVMVSDEHPNHLVHHIKDSRLEIFPEGKHNLHLRYWKEFNAAVERFLLE